MLAREELAVLVASAAQPHFSLEPESAMAIKVPEEGLNSDVYAEADYRAHLITVMAMRAVEAALR